MDLKPEKLFAALNQTSETAIKALAFARESRERAEKIAAMVAAFPVIAKGDKGERGEPGQSVDLLAVDQTIKELVAKIPPAPQGKPGRDGRDGKDADVKALEARIDTHAATVFPKALETARTAAIDAVPEIVRTELAQAISQLPKPENGKDGKDGDCACLARVWKGNWDRGTLYQPGDVFGFRGSSYVVLRECRGILPSVAAQRGPNPYYGVLAAAGAPGIANITQGGGASGTVTSVALAAPSFLTVSGSPVTTDGTLTLALATQAANTVFAGPTSGASAAPTFRGLVVDDIPDLTSLYDAQGEADSALVSAVAYTDSEIAALSSVYQPATGYSQGDLLYGNGGGTLSKLAEPGLPGYVLSAAGGAPSWVQLSTLTATTITGTANQVLVNGTSGSGQTGTVTLTGPQDLGTASTPQFARLGINQTAHSAVPLFATANSGQPVAVFLTDSEGRGVRVATSDYALGTTGSLVQIAMGAGTGDTYGVIESRTSGTTANGNLILQPNGGNVGVGLTAPLARLHVAAAAGNPVAVFLTDLDGRGVRVATSDYVVGVPTGTVVQVATGAGTGNTHGIIETRISGTSAAGVTALHPNGGRVLVGTTTDDGSTRLQVAGAVLTESPSGGSAQPWKWGNYTAGAATQAGTVRVEINGTPYDLLTA